MTTSTIPTAAKRKEIVRHGPSTLGVVCVHRGTELGDTTVPSEILFSSARRWLSG
jgi:hypothetical protein